MNRKSGRALVGMIVACVIGLVLVGVFVIGPQSLTGQKSGSDRPDGKGETLVGRSMLRAKDTKCREHLNQVRMAVSIQTDPVEGIKPESLEAIQGISSVSSCPVGNEKYTYDPATGDVKCPHPGHEKY